MPRTALLMMSRMTRGLVTIEEIAVLVNAVDKSPRTPSSSTLQAIESRYMKTFWIMMSMSAPFPFIRYSL